MDPLYVALYGFNGHDDPIYQVGSEPRSLALTKGLLLRRSNGIRYRQTPRKLKQPDLTWTEYVDGSYRCDVETGSGVVNLYAVRIHLPGPKLIPGRKLLDD